MALLHRDRPDTTTEDTVAAPGTTDRPGWPRHTNEVERPVSEPQIVRRNSVGQTVRTVLATILLVGIVAVAAGNTDDVRIDYLFDEYSTPMWAFAAGFAVAGFLVAGLLTMGRRNRVRF